MKKINEPITVRCGKERDGFEKLQALCEKEAEKMVESINISTGEEMEVVFWTSDPCSELIGVAYFTKDEEGKVTYKLDYSETTL